MLEKTLDHITMWRHHPQLAKAQLLDILLDRDNSWISEVTGSGLHDIKRIRQQISASETAAYLEKKEAELDRSGVESVGGGYGKHAEDIYTLIRAAEPEIVVETGVANGFTTLLILEALSANGSGHLYSIDLPNTDDRSAGPDAKQFIPEGENPGWIIPDRLTGQWTLQLGNARQLLPKLLEDEGKIDIFIHDSKHTYDHMLFEYETAWPHVVDRGVLISDDIDANDAFSDFATNVQYRSRHYFSSCLGAIQK